MKGPATTRLAGQGMHTQVPCHDAGTWCAIRQGGNPSPARPAPRLWFCSQTPSALPLDALRAAIGEMHNASCLSAASPRCHVETNTTRRIWSSVLASSTGAPTPPTPKAPTAIALGAVSARVASALVACYNRPAVIAWMIATQSMSTTLEVQF